ncbi:hypothetical protein EVG20_g9157 [Dentipellis fragilis]|uniref:Uncharacterized protein n=1 Tax=Dentipellis fragilis TaxID=205917 RepID=A0A4Y9Y4Z8_9AGAM|nr:hypothetical protein EVG20_g9157 [Dentipellis fragilis]
MSSDESTQQAGDAQGDSGVQTTGAAEAITFSPDVVDACQVIVQKFRAGQYGRVKATLAIYSAIPDDGLTEDEHYQVVEVYLGMLDNFIEKHKNALARGVEAQLDESPLRQKRPRIADSDDEDDTDDFHTYGKRPELDLADLPWVHDDAGAPLDEDLEETRKLLARFAQDPKGIKTSVLNARNCPQFPDSEWTNIITRRAVNLDHVLTGLYNVSVDTKHKERLGAIEFSISAIAPAKTVKSHGEWSTAWDHTVTATAFIFRHCRAELVKYMAFISQFFVVFGAAHHDRIFSFDKAVRICSGSPDLALDPAKPSLLGCLSDDREAAPLDRGGAMHASDGMMGVVPMPPEIATMRTAPVKTRISLRPRAIGGGSYGIQMHGQSSTPAADWSLTAAPLPGPPENELNNAATQETLAKYPHLFKVVMPINVDKFESLLKDHPNKPFVESVCCGLREGFWPSADTSDPEYPVTWDNSKHELASEEHRLFVEEQCQKEIAVGRFSEPWEADELYPGMYSMPIGVIPKPNSDKLQLVTDHSAGKFSLNSMIAKPEHNNKVQLDNIHDLGHNLLQVRHLLPHLELDLFKSDVAEAYRLMPMHPTWQIKQIVTVGQSGWSTVVRFWRSSFRQHLVRVHESRAVDRGVREGDSRPPGLFGRHLLVGVPGQFCLVRSLRDTSPPKAA